jgi:UDP-N-acetylglucosamine--N-acetylmuramyl-(pentapeptide) pyrophosphoryl-undecaprenol N-acetylglucosamine transferase
MTGGGTAGHVFPGLAVAEELSRRWQGTVFWIGGAAGIERSLVDRAGLPFHSIPAGKLRRYFSLKNLTDVARVAAGIAASLRILRRERPRVLFSKGGFVSVPPVVAAHFLGIPCITHESDFDPGLATRINMRFCEVVCLSWSQTLSYLPAEAARRAVVTGNPVRAALAAADPARGRAFVGCPAETALVLVIGGSQGSSFLNGLVASCLPQLRRVAFVAHQMGERDYAPAEGPRYFTAGFIAEGMPDLMAAADLVVCRSGANTLAELAVLGRPSVLVPLSTSGSRGDQVRNARMFAEAGAALVLDEDATDGAALLAAVTGLLGDPARLADMGRRARALARPGAAAAIAHEILRRAAPPDAAVDTAGSSLGGLPKGTG